MSPDVAPALGYYAAPLMASCRLSGSQVATGLASQQRRQSACRFLRTVLVDLPAGDPDLLSSNEEVRCASSSGSSRTSLSLAENVRQNATLRVAPSVPSIASSVAHERPQQLKCDGDRMDVHRPGLCDFGEGVLDPCELVLVSAFPFHDPLSGVGSLGTATACCPEN